MGARQFIYKKIHRQCFWRQFTDTFHCFIALCHSNGDIVQDQTMRGSSPLFSHPLKKSQKYRVFKQYRSWSTEKSQSYQVSIQCWTSIGTPVKCPLIVALGSFLPSSTKDKKKKEKKWFQSWTPSDKISGSGHAAVIIYKSLALGPAFNHGVWFPASTVCPMTLKAVAQSPYDLIAVSGSLNTNTYKHTKFLKKYKLDKIRSKGET